jgi:hypothetical protein
MFLNILVGVAFINSRQRVGIVLVSTKEWKKKEGFLPSLERMNRPGWSPWSAGWRGFEEQKFRPEVVVNGHRGGRDGGEHSQVPQGGGTGCGCSPVTELCSSLRQWGGHRSPAGSGVDIGLGVTEGGFPFPACNVSD